MKKIQVSTVEMKAMCEVINLNSSFVARAVRAADIAKSLKNRIEECCERYVLDEDGNRVVDANGKEVKEFALTSLYLQSEEVDTVYNRLVPFIIELCDALLGEE
jgi:septation ring formation regulator EzrA